jgi:hypothetical protein
MPIFVKYQISKYFFNLSFSFVNKRMIIAPEFAAKQAVFTNSISR